MTLSLWAEAAHDIEAETAGLRMARAKVAVAGLWPFLALARSEGEFEHRLALTASHIAERVDVDLVDPVVASLRDDFREVTARATTNDRKCEDCGAESGKDCEPGCSSHGDRDDDEDSPTKPGWLQDKIDGKTSAQIWHVGRQEWISVQASEADPTEGNPYYFTGGPEAGPATGDTNQFPPHPTGSDPIDPLTQMYPAQPQPWVVPPDKGWKENPMSFAPYKAASGPPPFDFEARYDHDHANCQDCGGGIHRTNGAGGWWQHDAGAPQSARHPARPDATYSLEANDYYRQHAHASQKTAEDGVEGRPGPNPNFFDGGGEGAAGDLQSGFSQSPSADPTDERVDMYGAVPPEQSSGSSGKRSAMAKLARPVWPINDRTGGLSMHDHVCPDCSGLFECHWPMLGVACQANTSFDHRHFHEGGFAEGEHDELPQAGPEHFASLAANMHRTAAATPSPQPPTQIVQQDELPDDKLLGTKLTPEERKRWDHAEGKPPIGNQGARTAAFYDPNDPSVRMVAAGADPFSSQPNPYTMGGGEDAAAPTPPPSMTGGPGSTAMPVMPQTTKPRQIPGAGGAAGADPNNPTPPEQPKEGSRRVAEQNMYRPSGENPYGTEDPFDAKTWGNEVNQRPRIPMEHMNFNGPQNPGAKQPIKTINSDPGAEDDGDDDDARRAAKLLFTQSVRELVDA